MRRIMKHRKKKKIRVNGVIKHGTRAEHANEILSKKILDGSSCAP
jgi:hypothetical protein